MLFSFRNIQDKYNFAVVTEDMSEKDIQKFNQDLLGVDFVKRSEV